MTTEELADAYRIIYAAKSLANALEAYEDHMRRLGE